MLKYELYGVNIYLCLWFCKYTFRCKSEFGKVVTRGIYGSKLIMIVSFLFDKINFNLVSIQHPRDWRWVTVQACVKAKWMSEPKGREYYWVFHWSFLEDTWRQKRVWTAYTSAIPRIWCVCLSGLTKPLSQSMLQTCKDSKTGLQERQGLFI